MSVSPSRDAPPPIWRATRVAPFESRPVARGSRLMCSVVSRAMPLLGDFDTLRPLPEATTAPVSAPLPVISHGPRCRENLEPEQARPVPLARANSIRCLRRDLGQSAPAAVLMG